MVPRRFTGQVVEIQTKHAIGRVGLVEEIGHLLQPSLPSRCVHRGIEGSHQETTALAEATVRVHALDPCLQLHVALGVRGGEEAIDFGVIETMIERDLSHGVGWHPGHVRHLDGVGPQGVGSRSGSFTIGSVVDLVGGRGGDLAGLQVSDPSWVRCDDLVPAARERFLLLPSIAFQMVEGIETVILLQREVPLLELTNRSDVVAGSGGNKALVDGAFAQCFVQVGRCRSKPSSRLREGHEEEAASAR